MPPMPALRLALLGSILLASALAAAQTTYRWIDPDSGRTVISDRPPPAGARQVVKQAGDEASEAPIPYATRQAAEKFPVVLYSAANCLDVCAQARELLNGRGIPFSEKMLNSQEALDEFARQLGGAATVPSIGVGRQSFKGFESTAWNKLLDLAGYPKSAPYGAKPSGVLAR